MREEEEGHSSDGHGESAAPPRAPPHQPHAPDAWDGSEESDVVVLAPPHHQRRPRWPFRSRRCLVGAFLLCVTLYYPARFPVPVATRSFLFLDVADLSPPLAHRRMDELYAGAVAVAGRGVDVIIAVGVLFVYAPQYLQIVRTGNAEGFSLTVPLILLSSNVLRIGYWVGERFAVPLLLQAFTTVVTMMVMLEVTLRFRNRKSQPPKHFADGQLRHFWDWDDFASYVKCVAVFSGAVCVVAGVSLSHHVVVGTMGFVALGVEALLPFPQWLRNRARRSTSGLSTVMICTWFVSDALKTVYFTTTNAPVPFVCCGVVQCLVDLLILFQIWTFAHPPTNPPHAAVAASTL